MSDFAQSFLGMFQRGFECSIIYYMVIARNASEALSITTL